MTSEPSCHLSDESSISTATLPRLVQMTAPKSSNSSARTSPRIACYGTAFLADAPVDANLLTHRIAPDAPQFSSPRLDASFLINCGRLLSGQLATTEGAPSTYIKRVAGSDFRSPKGTVIYECSTELHGLLAALTPERAGKMATEWYSMGLPAIGWYCLGTSRPMRTPAPAAGIRANRRAGMGGEL